MQRSPACSVVSVSTPALRSKHVVGHDRQQAALLSWCLSHEKRREHLSFHCLAEASLSTQKGASSVRARKSRLVTCTKRLSSNMLT